MNRLEVVALMFRRVRRITRHGVVCADRQPGRFNGYTWRARIKVVGARSADQAVDWMRP